MAILVNNTPILGPDGQPLGGAVVRLIRPGNAAVVGESLSAPGWVGSLPVPIGCHLGFAGNDSSTLFIDDYGGNAWTTIGSPVRAVMQEMWGRRAMSSPAASPVAAITTPANAKWSFGTGDFYIRAQIRPASIPSSGIYGVVGAWASNAGWAVAISPGGKIRLSVDGTVPGETASSLIVASTVHLVEVSRVSGSLRIDIDGVRRLETAFAGAVDTALPLCVGSANNTAQGFHGHISGVTVIKGGYITNGNVSAMPPPPDFQKGIYRIATDHVGEVTMVASVPSTLSNYPDKVTRVMV